MAVSPPTSDIDFILSQFVQDAFPLNAGSPPDAATMDMDLEDLRTGNKTLSAMLQESEVTGENGSSKLGFG